MNQTALVRTDERFHLQIPWANFLMMPPKAPFEKNASAARRLVGFHHGRESSASKASFDSRERSPSSRGP
jgi:hypothetical protein